MARAQNKLRYPVADLWQGVSSQPPWKQFPGQVRDSLNMQHDTLDGARSRNATDLIGSSPLFSTTNPEAAYFGQPVRIIPFRDKFIAIGDGLVLAFDEAFNPLPVEDLAGDGFAYLSGIDPLTDIDWTSAIDTIVVTNRTTTARVEKTPNYAVTGSVNVFSDLASQVAVPGDRFRVVLSENLDPAGYYEKQPNGSWKRIAAPDDPEGRFVVETLPHRLLYDETLDRFSWARLPLNDRLSGTATSNAAPRFAGEKIASVEFHSGRLFFVSKAAVEASRSSDIFSWFVNDVEQVAESDRISIDILNGEVGDPLYAVTMGADLFMLCESGQLAFSAGDEQLTSTNGRVRYLADYKPKDLRPATNGQQVVFLDQFNDVHVYQWGGLVNGVQYLGSPNRHAQKFFQSNPIRDIYLIESTIFLVAEDWTLFVHDYTLQEGRVAQSAWSRYRFFDEAGAGGQTLAMAPWEDRIRLVQAGPELRLVDYRHRPPVDPPGFAYSPRLDQRERVVAEAYEDERDQTRFTHAAALADPERSEVHTPQGEILKPARVDSRNVWVEGKIEGEVFLGFNYEASIDLPPLYAGASDIRPKLRSFNVFHDRSTDYEVLSGRDEESLRVLPWQGASTSVGSVGDSTVNTGHSRHSLTGDARSTFIRIRSRTGGPFTVSAVEYGYTTRGG